MNRNITLIIFLFSFHTSIAQIPKIDNSFHEIEAVQKTQHYRQMVLCERQKTANQENFDVLYYSLDLIPDANTMFLEGIVKVTARIESAAMDQIDLNFWDGMSVTSVFLSDVLDVQLSFERHNDMLTIHMDRTYDPGEYFSITIAYEGQPQESPYRSFVFDSYQNQPMIWTLSSVFGARAWWPCKDVPSDKPDSVDIRVSVPSDLVVASNGSLRETKTAANRTTYWWHEKYPIATYLVFLAIYPYDVFYDFYYPKNSASPMAIHFYSFPGNYQAHYQINTKVKDILTCFSELFGEYPFVDEKYGQADFLWSGGMEHQTCTTYGRWNEGLYAHEISHQWWGDMITCENFSHIWLNEGFASYCEALWFEYAYPPFTASEYQMMYQLYLGPGTVYVEHPEYENIFDSNLSYVKGSWILHMLRHVVGDENFFKILKAYCASDKKYATATSEDFQEICENVSGLDLNKFFYQWIYEEYYPHYSYSWTSQEINSGFSVQLEIKQNQTNFLFWMPIDITVETLSGETTFVVWDSLETQSFQFYVSSQPRNVQLDKDNWILKKMPEKFENPTFDSGILLVNGISFETYGEEIRSFYQDMAFRGDFPITLWDCFNPTEGGYPATLPEPIGFGRVPADVLKKYSTVIWMGNNNSGDLGSWQQTSILPFLKAGGNVLLLTRNGQDFIDSDLQEYLGITWAEQPLSTINNCMAAFSGLLDIPLIGEQSGCAVFERELSHTFSTLLFQETLSYAKSRGLGVWCCPPDGGLSRNNGGQFVFISGRPYRYRTGQLRANIEFILTNFFDEPLSQTNGDKKPYRIDQNYPNPFNHLTTIRYFSNEPQNITIKIYNVEGKLVKSLLNNAPCEKGFGTVIWNGENANGAKAGSGIYFCQFKVDNYCEIKKMLMVK